MKRAILSLFLTFFLLMSLISLSACTDDHSTQNNPSRNNGSTSSLATDSTLSTPPSDTSSTQTNEVNYNLSILDVEFSRYENSGFTMQIDAVCNGASENVTFSCSIEGSAYTENWDTIASAFTFTVNANLIDGEVTTISIPSYTPEDFDTFEAYDAAFQHDYPGLYNLAKYRTVDISVDVQDQDLDDNRFIISGYPSVLEIVYCSDNPNSFFPASIMIFRDLVSQTTDVMFTEVRISDDAPEEIPTSGFDIYILEGCMPAVMPTDGLCILVNPTTAPQGSNLSIGHTYQTQMPLTFDAGEKHPIMDNVIATNIQCTRFTDITALDPSYMPILYCQNFPVAYATEKSEDSTNVVVFSFSMNYSDFPLLADFPLMMYNIIDYYVFSNVHHGQASYTFRSARMSDKYQPSNQVIDGQTYYGDILEQYYELWIETSTDRKCTLTRKQIAIIEMYFEFYFSP